MTHCPDKRLHLHPYVCLFECTSPTPGFVGTSSLNIGDVVGRFSLVGLHLSITMARWCGKQHEESFKVSPIYFGVEEFGGTGRIVSTIVKESSSIISRNAENCYTLSCLDMA